MDFTLEDWEQLGVDQGDLFWDTALDNYQKLFLLNPLRPNLTVPDGGEELETPVRGSPEATGPDTAEAKISLPQEFSEEGLSQEITEVFSKDGLWNSNLGDPCMGESWLDSLLGDPESLLSSDAVTKKESPTECTGHVLESSLSLESLLFTGEDSLIPDLSKKSLTPAKSQESRNDSVSHSDQSQQNTVQEGTKPYKCSECGKNFSRTCSLLQHWIIHMSEKPTGDQECEDCVSQSSCLFVYPATHTGYKSYACNKCGETFSHDTHLLWHQKTHTEEEKTHMSRESDHPLGPGSQLIEHQNSHQGDRPHRCDECGKSFSQTIHFSQHQKTHAQKGYDCTKCPATFNVNKRLLQHQKIHAAKTTSECQECGKAFRQRASLIKHQSAHAREKPFKCDECGKAFIHILTLKSHQRVHSREKPYKCNECGKAFYRNTHLNEHQRIHTGYRPHKCDKCTRSFSRPSHLTRHQSVHAAEKPSRSAERKETFSRNECLVQHQKSHAVETRHESQECGKHFICSSTLTSHQSIPTQEKQGLDKSGKILNQNLEQKEHSRTGEKTFTGSRCLTQHERLHTREKPFGQSSQLIRHQMTHSGVGSYKCEDCGKAFIRSPSLTKHQCVYKSKYPFKCNDCGKTFSATVHISQNIS